MSERKQSTEDIYHCPDCGFEWGGYNRPPPYPHCPECGYGMLDEGPYDDGSQEEKLEGEHQVVDSWFDEDEEVVKYVAENDDGESITGVITRKIGPNMILSKKAARSMARDLEGTHIKDRTDHAK